LHRYNFFLQHCGREATGTSITFAIGEDVFCEIAWIDPPTPTEQIRELKNAVADFLDKSVDEDN
jgi:hypothetical protein